MNDPGRYYYQPDLRAASDIRDRRNIQDRIFDLELHELNILTPAFSRGCRLLEIEAEEICLDARKIMVGGSPASAPTTLDEIPNAWEYLCYVVRCERAPKPGLPP